MTLPSTTLEEEFRRPDDALSAVAAYCKFEEGGTPCNRAKSCTNPSPAKQADSSLMAAYAEKQALGAAMWAVLKVCFGRSRFQTLL